MRANWCREDRGEQMIMHAPGSRVPDDFERVRRGEPPPRLGIHESAGRGSRRDGGEKRVPWIVGERRVDEHDVEMPPLARCEAQRVVDVHLERQLADRARALDERADERRIPVDCDRQRRAARQRLQRQHARSGVEVERRRAGQVLAEPVEKRLAHPVRRRPQAWRRSDGDLPATMPAADDADPMRCGHRGLAQVPGSDERPVTNG